MAFDEFSFIIGRVALKGEDYKEYERFAGRRYWRVAAIFTEEDNPDIISESIEMPASRDYLINFIHDKMTAEPFVLIRIRPGATRVTLEEAKKTYQEMLAQLPVYSLPEILKRSKNNPSEGEIHALGKGYDPEHQSEIRGLLTSFANNEKTPVEQKKAAIIAIGYISDPKNFNPILERFTQDPNSEVAELAKSMLQAGHAILNR